jgi:ubiquinone/menaquinone biosynthesis C-methylase UbiE
LDHTLDAAALIAAGTAAGLKLNRFKRTMALPRVKAVIGALQGIRPQTLLDIGTGRGVFLWPLLDQLPEIVATAVELDERRRAHLEAVHRGGITRLNVVGADGASLPFENDRFDVVTALEVLEHQADPMPMAREAVRVGRRFVLASVPSKPDDNPEHVQLFSGERLARLLEDAGVESVRISYVPNHIVAVARI